VRWRGTVASSVTLLGTDSALIFSLGSSAMRTEPYCPYELVDLTVPLPVDSPPNLALDSTSGCTRESSSLVAVLDRFDVSEVSGKPVEL